MAYVFPTTKSYIGIQFGELRAVVSPKFVAFHAYLSDCYYNKKEFTHDGHNWGLLTKEQFDKLHGLNEHLRFIAFHLANINRSIEERIPEEQYRYSTNEEKVTRDYVAETQVKIQELQSEGYELNIV